MKKTVLPFFTLCVALLFGNLSIGQIVINEYSCSNKNTLADNFGKYNDWIELYNSGATPVNLAGYYLTDNPTKLDKYTIPAITLNPGSFVVFHCSNRNTVSGAYYHTNFKLTQTTYEKLILSNPSLVILDSLTLNPTQLNHSRGRTVNGSPSWSLFTTPTPNATNINPKNDYVPRPSVSTNAGFYNSSVDVSISCADPAAQIRFTLNGSTPTLTSPLYVSTLTIAGTMVIRARAFSSDPNTPPSFVESNSYFLNITHGLAVVSIFGDQINNLLSGTQLKPETGMELFTNTGAFLTESYGSANEHGNDSWAYAQRGIDFIAGDIYGYSHALVGQIFSRKSRTEFQRVILKASANDNYPFGNGGTNGPAHVRDSYVHTLSQRSNLHMDERTSEYVVMYVNGAYWGVYDIREKVDDSDFLDYYHDQNELYDNSPNYIQYIKTWGSTWAEYGGSQATADWSTIRNYIETNNMAVQANYDYAASIFNVKSMVDYFVLNSFIVSSDWLNWNTSWWRGINPNGDAKKWRYSLWDNDATFGHYINYTGVPTTGPSANPCDPQTIGNVGGQGHVNILNALLANQSFKDYYISRFIDLNNTTLNCSYMQHLLDSMLGLITPEMQRQTTRWGGTVAGWQTNVQQMKTYIDARCLAIQTGLMDCYTLNGPYTTTFLVDPPGFGTIQINSITPTNYPFSGTYYGGIPVSMVANPVPNGTFVGWTTTNHTVSPDPDSTIASISLSTSDTVVAHFSMTGIPTIENNEMSMRIYPTAVNHTFMIEYKVNHDGPIDIEIFSLTGSKVAVVNSTPSLERINLKYVEVNPSSFGMSPGMYFVSLRSKSGILTQKIVYLGN